MDSDHVLVLLLSLLLVGSAIGLALSSPSLLAGDGDGAENVTDASLIAFETVGPVCGDPNTTSLSAVSTDAPAGERLVLTQTVPVATNDTTVSATLNEFGPQRFVLALESETPEPTATRTPTATPTPTPTATPTNETAAATDGTAAADATTATESNAANVTGANGTAPDGSAPNGTTAATATTEPTADGTATPTPGGADCHPAVRYNATIAVDQPSDYTVVVTYDGELVAAHWSEGDDVGSIDRLPELPETETVNATATNAGSLRRWRP